MEYDYQVYLLSQKFVNDYPLSKYPELVYKAGRPYNCLLIDTHDDFFICVPYRSHITHSDAFMFKGTQRSKTKKSGLDYTKIVLVKDNGYLNTNQAIVDNDEYIETVKHMPRIIQEVDDYIKKYIDHVTGTKKLHPKEFKRHYQFSTLPYFHDIMEI